LLLDPRSFPTRRSSDLAAAGGRRPKVRAQAVEKTFVPRGASPVQALGGVDLVVREGEFISIVGPSGCGKSTLLRMVANLDRPSRSEEHTSELQSRENLV